MTSQLLDHAEPKTGRSRISEPLTQMAEERSLLLEDYDPKNLRLNNIDWPVLGFMVLVHAGLFAAPFFFTWQALGVAVLFHWLTCSIGICLAYHRYLAHRSFKLVWPARMATMFFGVLSGEGTPLTWAATHRLHHARSDQPGDPHSPLDGKWWSHLLWIFVRHDQEHMEKMYRHYVPDLAKDPVLRMYERTYALWLFGMAGVFYAVGGWPFLLWGVCVRMFFAYHSTWFVNSATHLWGYRNYETTDQSRNLWWVAILAYGEGWHNNHHAHPKVAPAGHKWWEFDMTWQAIKVLRFFHLAYDVDDRIPVDS